MKKIKLILLIAFLSVVYSTGCAQDKSKTISVDELKQKMKTDSSLVILDVRTPEELNGPLGKLDRAINIPVQDLDKRINELENYKDKDIAVICRSGHRSAKAQEILQSHGFNKSKSVSGGMTEYRNDEQKNDKEDKNAKK
ncbi:MAG: rhodanese-like domain-containing protein [Bacillota bacterium]